MHPFKKFTLLDESITTIATNHTIPNNMEKKQIELLKNELRSNMINHILSPGIQFAIDKIDNLDRESPSVMPKHAGNRFEIENSGRPFLAFETEAHIVDDQNPGCTIIVKSGYSTLEETNEYANKILKILNDGSL